MIFRRRRPFTFENFAGTYQMSIKSADDLVALDQLDEPFWLAVSAPVEHFTCDPVLLERIDKTPDKRLQSWELREAVRWLLRMLADRSGVTARSDVLALNAIDTSHGEGRRLQEAARRVLANLDKGHGEKLSLAEIRDSRPIFAKGGQNGDGIIPASAADAPELHEFVEDIIATVGSVEDINGMPGVDAGLLDKFLHNAEALLAWQRVSQDEASRLPLYPLGDATPECYALYQSLSGAIDGFFQLCRVAALNEYLECAAPEPSCPPAALTPGPEADAYLASAPLSRPRADGTLRLDSCVNPWYEPDLARLAEKVMAPVLGGAFDGVELDEEQWLQVKQVFGPYEKWLASKTGGQVETLGPTKLASYIESDLPQRLRTLIESDTAAGAALAALHDLEYLVLLQRWLLDICNNFVSFPYLYMPSERAMFERGRLIMDGCIFNLNIQVADANEHSARAARSGAYLLYSEVTGGANGKRFYIVTPVTRGRVDVLVPGKRGVLFDLDGREWDAQVVKVIENPVSLTAAILAPFRRIAKLIGLTIEKISTGAEQQLATQLASTGATLDTSIKQGIAAPPQTPPPVEQPPVPAPMRMRDMLLGGGVAIAAISSAFVFIAKTFSGMHWEHVAIALVVGLAIILVPTAIIGYVKLRRRNLSAILEASGWAINAPMRLTRQLRKNLVFHPPHPKGFGWRRKDKVRKAVRNGKSEE